MAILHTFAVTGPRSGLEMPRPASDLARGSSRADGACSSVQKGWPKLNGCSKPLSAIFWTGPQRVSENDRFQSGVDGLNFFRFGSALRQPQVSAEPGNASPT